MRIAIGHIALIEKEKRQHITIQTVEELCSMGHDAYALIVGAPSEQSSDYVSQLKASTETELLAKRVFFLGRRKDIPDIMRNLDIIIIPSSFEGFPLTGLEACAAGVPIIACDVGGAKEFIDVSGAGVCFKFDDSQDAAHKIESVLLNKENHITAGTEFAKRNTATLYAKAFGKVFAKLDTGVDSRL